VLGEGECNTVKRKRSAPVAFSFKLFFAVVELTEADMRQFEADFEMAIDMFEMALDEKGKNLPNTDEDNLLERFKKSDYESARRLRL